MQTRVVYSRCFNLFGAFLAAAPLHLKPVSHWSAGAARFFTRDINGATDMCCRPEELCYAAILMAVTLM